MQDDLYHFVRILVVENEIESQVLTSFLRERNIPHRIQSYHDTAYDGLFQVQKGWGVLQAPESFREEILDIVTGLRDDGGTNSVR